MDLNFAYEVASIALTAENLFAIFVGLVVGGVLGAIPGLNGTMAIALMIPLTFTWSPLFSIAILIGVWKGGVYAGCISGILLNTPGSPDNAPSAIDGYPLSQKGLGEKALITALVASVIGALVSDVILIIAATPVSRIALSFGPPELAALMVFALIVVAGVGSDSHAKGIIGIAIGVLIGTVGLDPNTGQRRFTFGLHELDDGVSLIAMLIGILVLSEILLQIEKGLRVSVAGKGSLFSILRRGSFTLKDFRSVAGTILRSSFLGSFLGALPGVGSVTAAYLGYDLARSSARDRAEFGKGDLRGVAGPEAANNAVCGTALIPLLTLGVPGTLAVAVIMSAFVIHGVTPGPLMIHENPHLIYSLFVLLLISDVMLFFVAIPLIIAAQWFVRISPAFLFPCIMAFCFYGAYGANYSVFDIKVMVFFGVAGYAFKKAGISVAAILIAFILAPMIERYSGQSLSMSRGDPMIFFNSITSTALLILGGLVLVASLFNGLKLMYKNYKQSND